MSSGPVSLSGRLEAVDKSLDDYEASLGLPGGCPREVEVEATRLLTLAPSSLRHLTAPDLGEAAYCLEQYGFFLQRAQNREQTRVRWAEENLRRLLATLLPSQKAYSLEERRALAIAGSDSARELEQIRVASQLRLERLQYQAQRVQGLARALLSLQQTRRGNGQA